MVKNLRFDLQPGNQMRLHNDNTKNQFSRLLQLLVRALDVPMAGLYLFERGELRPAAMLGLTTGNGEASFAHALAGDAVLSVPDLRLVSRFADHPMVVGAPGLRFYAGVALHGQDGFNLGTLFVLDHKTREALSPGQTETLQDISKLLTVTLENTNQPSVPVNRALQAAQLTVLTLDGRGRVLAFEGQTVPELGLSAGSVGRHAFELNESAEFIEAAGNALGGSSSRFDIEEEDDDDGRVLEVRCLPLRDGAAISGAAIVVADATEQRKTEAQLMHQASHDSLTGLPNQALFMDRFRHALIRSGRDAEPIAVCLVDLDRFKLVNDTLGHTAGNELLTEVARRLQASVREGDTVSRLGGDEFMLLLPGVRSPSSAERMAEKIIANLKRPFNIERNNVMISASIGIAMYPFDGEDADTLIKNADAAQYRAKNAGKDGYQLYTRELTEADQARAELEHYLRFALERGELSLSYQPRFDLSNHQIVGMEALLRWQHPDLGSIAPSRFLPVAEVSGLIVPIGAWVLGEACREAKTWQLSGRRVRVAVNISGLQFRRPDFLKSVQRALEASGLEPELLELELNEMVIFETIEESVKRLDDLHELGVRVTLENFPGSNNLEQLAGLQVDALKIEGPMVRELFAGPSIEAFVTQARRLRVQVNAEGVETEPQLGVLRRLGVREAQGFLLAKPMHAEMVHEFLASKHHAAGL